MRNSRNHRDLIAEVTRERLGRACWKHIVPAKIATEAIGRGLRRAILGGDRYGRTGGDS